ncbi:hypothetical protein ISCGN_024240 [Ixodes scapularis]
MTRCVVLLRYGHSQLRHFLLPSLLGVRNVQHSPPVVMSRGNSPVVVGVIVFCSIGAMPERTRTVRTSHEAAAIPAAGKTTPLVCAPTILNSCRRPTVPGLQIASLHRKNRHRSSRGPCHTAMPSVFYRGMA